MNTMQNQAIFEACLRKVAKRTGVAEEIVRSVVQSGMLENIPPHHTLRGIYRMYTDERSKAT